MVYKLRELAGQVDRYPLAAMCRRHSDGRTDDPAKLTPREAWKLIEAYKAIGAREDARPAVPAAAATPPAATDEDTLLNLWAGIGAGRRGHGRPTVQQLGGVEHGARHFDVADARRRSRVRVPPAPLPTSSKIDQC